MARTRLNGARPRSSTGPRRRTGEGQYSLFAAAPGAGARDASHFRRQAALCRRLAASLHQDELLSLLFRLEGEFEDAAARLDESGG